VTMQNDVSNVKSAQRTTKILELLSESSGPLSLAEIQQATAYPRSSLHALLKTLRDERWLQSEPGGSRYQVGPRALLVGTSYLDKDPALPFANQTLEAIRAATGHTVHYARRDADSVIYLVSRESMVSVQQVYRIGRRVPASLTGLGLALFAELTDDEIARLVPEQLPQHTDRSLATRDELMEQVRLVRERGWAMELGYGVPNVGCIAATVSYRIPATDAISCSVPIEELHDDTRRAEIVDIVRSHVNTLAHQLRREGIR